MVTGVNVNTDIMTSDKSNSVHSKQGDFKKNVLTCWYGNTEGHASFRCIDILCKS